MVCHCIIPSVCPRPDTTTPHLATPPCLATSPHSAKAMTPAQRRQLALEALVGTETVSRLAGQHEVSRKFVYQQTAKAEEALDAAFWPADGDPSALQTHESLF